MTANDEANVWRCSCQLQRELILKHSGHIFADLQEKPRRPYLLLIEKIVERTKGYASVGCIAI